MSFYTNSSPVRNGDLLVKAGTRAQVASLVNQQGFQDWSTLQTWFEEDPLRNLMRLETWFGQQGISKRPSFLQDILENDAMLEVNGWEGTFRYEVPVESDTRLKTMDDTSYQMYAGANGTAFEVVFNQEFAPNTKLTCDGLDGDEIIVSEAHPVENLGYGFRHMVTLLTEDPDKTYPAYLLEKDIEYFEIGGGIAEYGEKLNLLQLPGATDYNMYEFQLGSGQGVETWVTGKADSVNLGLGTTYTKDFMNEVEQYYRRGEEVVVIQDKMPNISNTRSVATMLEMLAVQKYKTNKSMSLLYGKGGKVPTQKGYVRFNEGLWPQLKRGYVITYGKRGGITKEHIKQARDYVFQANPYKTTIDSVIRFKAGTQAYNNVLKIYKDEVNHQLQNIAPLLGADRLLPRNPISGDLYNLALEPVRFTKVYLPDIGMVEIQEDKSLDYTGVVDKNLAGMNPNGTDYTTYSMIIWDAMDQAYSNNAQFPAGTSPVGNNREANIWMVVPQGEKLYWGRENGRYDASKARDIVASAKTMHTSFFIYGFGAIWVKDPSRFVMIELSKEARKGYK